MDAVETEKAAAERYPDCPREDWSNGRRRCPHGCGVHCQRNTAVQREHGRRLSERLENLTDDDWDWLAGTGRYRQ